MSFVLSLCVRYIVNQFLYEFTTVPYMHQLIFAVDGFSLAMGIFRKISHINAAMTIVTNASVPYPATPEICDQAIPVFESKEVRLYRVRASSPPQISEEFPLQGFVHLELSFNLSDSSDTEELHQHSRPRLY